MANKRIHELTADTTPDADAYLVLDKSTYAAPVKATVTQLLQNLPVAPQTAGGNARGTGAVDLQVERNTDAQVASGTCAVICGGISGTASGSYAAICGGISGTASGYAAFVGGGNNGTASGSYAVICGGNNGTASGTCAVICGGVSGTASGPYAAICGGISGTASGYAAFVGGGNAGTASGPYAVICGGNTGTASGYAASVCGGEGNIASGNLATVPGGGGCVASGYCSQAAGLSAVADKRGQHAQSSFAFTAAGDAQRSSFSAGWETEDATPTPLFLDHNISYLTIADDTAWLFRADVIGITSDAAAYGGYTVTGVVRRSNGTVTVHGVTTVTVAESTAGWNATATADDTNKALSIVVTGAAGTTIRWHAAIYTSEITYA